MTEPSIPAHEILLTFLPKWAWKTKSGPGLPITTLDKISFFLVHGSIKLEEGIYTITIPVKLQNIILGQPDLPLTVIVSLQNDPKNLIEQKIVLSPNDQVTNIVTKEFKLSDPGTQVDVFLTFGGNPKELTEGLVVFGATYELVTGP